MRDRDSRNSRKSRTIVTGEEFMKNQKSGGDRSPIRAPAGVNTIVPKAGNVYSLVFVPFPITKPKFRPSGKKGDLCPELAYNAHMRIGPNNNGYFCPFYMFQKPCPICEELKKFGFVPDTDKEKYDLKRSLMTKLRKAYNVVDINNAGKGVQLLDTSYHTFGKNLKDALDMEMKVDPTKGRRITQFYDPDRPYIVTFQAVEVELKYKFTTCQNFKFRKFVDNDGKMPEDWLDKAVLLDDLVTEPSYEELRDAFTADPEEGDEPPSRKKGRKDEDDEDDEDSEVDDDDDEDDSEVDDEEDEDDDEDDEEEKDWSKTKKKSSGGVKSKLGKKKPRR